MKVLQYKSRIQIRNLCNIIQNLALVFGFVKHYSV
jgi:hypothetical protein